MAVKKSKPRVASGINEGTSGMPDRVWFSAGLTIKTGDYETARVDAGMSSDVGPGETPKKAMDRVSEFVVEEVNLQISDVRASLMRDDESRPRKKRSR